MENCTVRKKELNLPPGFCEEVLSKLFWPATLHYWLERKFSHNPGTQRLLNCKQRWGRRILDDLLMHRQEKSSQFLLQPHVPITTPGLARGRPFLINWNKTHQISKSRLPERNIAFTYRKATRWLDVTSYIQHSPFPQIAQHNHSLIRATLATIENRTRNMRSTTSSLSTFSVMTALFSFCTWKAEKYTTRTFQLLETSYSIP